MAKLHTREILNYEKSCRPICSERLTEYSAVSPGDHIHWKHVGSWYTGIIWRDGIVVRVKTEGNTPEIAIIRYGLVDVDTGMEVRQESWIIDFTKEDVHIYDYEDHCHSSSIVLKRARACIGVDGYNALRNTNDDFCRWCKSGKHTYLCIDETLLCSNNDERAANKERVNCSERHNENRKENQSDASNQDDDALKNDTNSEDGTRAIIAESAENAHHNPAQQQGDAQFSALNNEDNTNNSDQNNKDFKHSDATDQVLDQEIGVQHDATDIEDDPHYDITDDSISGNFVLCQDGGVRSDVLNVRDNAQYDKIDRENSSHDVTNAADSIQYDVTDGENISHDITNTAENTQYEATDGESRSNDVAKQMQEQRTQNNSANVEGDKQSPTTLDQVVQSSGTEEDEIMDSHVKQSDDGICDDRKQTNTTKQHSTNQADIVSHIVVNDGENSKYNLTNSTAVQVCSCQNTNYDDGKKQDDKINNVVSSSQAVIREQGIVNKENNMDQRDTNRANDASQPAANQQAGSTADKTKQFDLRNSAIKQTDVSEENDAIDQVGSLERDDVINQDDDRDEDVTDRGSSLEGDAVTNRGNDAHQNDILKKGESTMDEELCVTIVSLDNINEGDHISWKRLYHCTTEKVASWRHGIVIDVDLKGAEVIGFAEETHAITSLRFTNLDMVDHVIRHHVYKRCHMPDDVIDRALSWIGHTIFPDSCHLLARCCKLGIPSDSDVVDKQVIAPSSNSDPISSENVDITKEASVAGTRSAVLVMSKTLEVGAKAETAKHASKFIARGATKGAMAAAALGVEAIILGVDVSLTYRSFSRRDISKDEVKKQHIQNFVRSAGAAAGSVGAGAKGAAIGSILFPGMGTLVGGIIGGVVGGITGQVGGHFAGKGLATLASRPYENYFIEADMKYVEDE